MAVALKEDSELRRSLVAEISGEIQKITGVQLGDRQAHMVESRLSKRVVDLGLGDFTSYAGYYRANSKSENEFLISLLTTHHTYFFRETSHFDFLESKALGDLVDQARQRGDRLIRVWSAACSRGQEVYSLGMALDFHLKARAPDVKWEIWGSDVDPESVAIAKNGVYRFDELKKVPMAMLGDHWARGTGDIANFVKVNGKLRAHCHFQPANLFKPGDYPKGIKFDVIFCRNVFIYFTPEQIDLVTSEILKCLTDKGYFFIGVSESIAQKTHQLKSLAPSVYQKKLAIESLPAAAGLRIVSKSPTPTNVEGARAAVVSSSERCLRVLCVDDSPSIHAILQKLLLPSNGFEIVGKAMNGIEAAEMVAKLKPDLMTLDLHMPLQTGIEYLKKNYKKGHPPVVIVSSASREDSEVAFQALQSGASDFVEKPSLQNMPERGEEIRAKLKMAWSTREAAASQSGLDAQFAKKIEVKNISAKLRILLGRLADEKKIVDSLREFHNTQLLTFVLCEGMENVLPNWGTKLSAAAGIAVKFWDPVNESKAPASGVFIVDAAKFFKILSFNYGAFSVSCLVYGEPSESVARAMLKVDKVQILIEDFGQVKNKDKSQLYKMATDCVPATSFAYMSNEFHSRGGGK